MSVAVISHQDCLQHKMGETHPESPQRLASIHQYIASSELTSHLDMLDAKTVDKTLLKLVHQADYIDYIFDNAPEQGEFRLDPDTLMISATLPAALLAAGAAVQAVDLVCQNQYNKVFCAIRPPGHHAEYDKAMGFCFFNNIALAAVYALKQYKLERVAILDFDVHHGNGTQNIVSNNPQVLFCSTFQHPFYPFSGAENTSTNIINTPLNANSGSEDFRQAVKQDWLPQLQRFQPNAIFISAGFDAHKEDQMAQLNLDDEDYFWVTQQLVEYAEQHCDGRIISMLEGGYAIDALGRSVVEHLRALVGNQ